MPLDGAETVALIVLLDLRTGGSRSQHRWVVETIEVFFFSPFFLSIIISLFIYFTNMPVCAGELSASPSGNLRIQSFQQTH